jgi:hypothetical protein
MKINKDKNNLPLEGNEQAKILIYKKEVLTKNKRPRNTIILIK